MPEQIIAVVPIRGSDGEFREGAMPLLGGRPLIEYTLRAAKEARRLDRVIVSTDSPAIADACRSYGVEVPFVRPLALSAPTVSVTEVLRHCVEWLERQERYRVDWVVKLEITHPFRPFGLIDTVIETALTNPVDSAFVAYEELNSYWTIDEHGRPEPVGQAVEVPRSVRRPFYRDVSGLVAITRAANLRAGTLYGNHVALIPVRDLFAIVDTHEKSDPASPVASGWRLAELLAPAFAEGLMEMR